MKFLLGHRFDMRVCYIVVFLMAVLPSAFAQSLISQNRLFYRSPSFQTLSATELDTWMESLSDSQDLKQEVIRVAEPLPRTLLPRNMAAIAFAWADKGPASTWILTIDVQGEKIAGALLDRPWWVPDILTWKTLKQQASNDLCHVAIRGVGGWNGRKILSKGRTSFLFSTEPLDARLMFMRKPLPFLTAKKNPGQTGLFAGDISSYEKPESIIQGFTVCTNCHAYSRNGRTMALDMDYTGDKGGFAVLDLQPCMMLGAESVYSWNDMPAIKPAAYSMGLFARMSPSGRYLAGTVNETSVFVMMNDIQFSQLFFPATGHIAIFDRQASKSFLLPGADLPGRVQTSPGWSPDGHTIAFAATPVQPDLVDQVLAGKLKKESSTWTIEDLNKKYPVQFDIYTLDFNDGCGGQAAPLEGASQNGLSNYFPRYSPDGQWIVFTQSPTGLVLQPQSRLCIVPAKGGTARVLAANQEIMNSWHTWSPDSRWMVFTCKANSPYTELYLTHIGKNGDSSPGVRLFRFSHNEQAAMVPEFVPVSADIPRSLVLASPEQAKGKSMATDGR